MMDFKQVLSFVKIEHTLFSLPFVLLGYFIALEQFGLTLGIDLMWILLAAVGARGLAMALNRIIDRNIDAKNPRTMQRHLASGSMSLPSAWLLAGGFLVLLLLSASMLNEVALMMAWLPVLAFVAYPFMKRFTWLCHLWLGLCLGLAPAGAWVAIAADIHGWASITGDLASGQEFLWLPTILPLSAGVALWITTFDINYARMDVESDRDQGVFSFPAQFGELATTIASGLLTVLWVGCFVLANPTDGHVFSASGVLLGLVHLFIIVRRDVLVDFQSRLFQVSMSTGWMLVLSLMF
ncbi:MAG: putative 4-hydroxybenzoate polyprenyltransferase [archaeon]|nr:putative 4-hydroxybenzoate polyprenyltransferase [archaeon]MDA1167452.1 putative 4-hydroxybenzoate polyprenyltransferase [archaeon]